MILSIILTVYNKADFLDRVFESLLNQDGEKEYYEVLVVNDGSTDNSLSIIQRYALENSNLRVLNQTNQGLSMARNNGVDSANGKYVWFVDADDCISTDAVKMIVEATSSQPDIIPIYAKTEGEPRIRNAVNRYAKTGKDILLMGGWEQCGVFNVFRRSFLLENHLRFIPGIYHEDADFTPRALYAAKSIKVVPQVLYTVFRDPESITQIPRSKRAFDYLTVASSLSQFVISNNETKSKIGTVIDGTSAICINNAMHIIVQNKAEDQELLCSVFYEKRYLLLRSLVNSRLRKYRIEAILFWVFPKHTVSVYKALKRIKNK